jgi:DNA-binding HxlR family transcriptional regulator
MPEQITILKTINQEKKRGARRKTAVSYERNCSVGRTVAILSDAWAFLILRECYFGATRFDTFRAALGIPRQTLTQRLRKLTVQGLLRRVKCSGNSLRFEYRLTRMGIDLYPVMLSLMSFGDKWLTGSSPPPLRLVHNKCGKTCRPIVTCPHCKAEVNVRTVSYRDGPGAGTTPVLETIKERRKVDRNIFDRGRPSSVARTLKVIGDRWSFMVIREGFFGVRRFDTLQTQLGIAPNILSDRLNRLVSDGIFERSKYQASPDRFEYRFTGKGKDLYGPMLAMLNWGNRWLSNGDPPLILTHKACGAVFEPAVICDQCEEPLAAADMSYKLSYLFAADEMRERKPNRPITD